MSEGRRHGGREEEDKFLWSIHALGLQVPLSQDLGENPCESALPHAAVKGGDLGNGWVPDYCTLRASRLLLALLLV